MKFREGCVKRTQGVAVAILVMMVLAFLTTQAFAYPTEYSLIMNLEIQERSNWCWAACSKAILRHFGTTVTQTQFVNYVKDSTSAPNLTASDAEVKHGLSHWGLSSSLSTSSLSFNTIISETYTYKRPIYAGWTWTGAPDGHSLVINGYNIDADNHVEYMDPDPYIGGFYLTTYDWFVGGSSYDHVWDGTVYNMNK